MLAIVLSGRFTYLDLLPDDRMIPRYKKAWGPQSEGNWKFRGALDWLGVRLGIGLIVVAQSMIFDSRMNVVNEIVRLKKGGCKVRVTVNKLQDEPKAAFTAAKIPVRRNETHDKIFLVDAILN